MPGRCSPPTPARTSRDMPLFPGCCRRTTTRMFARFLTRKPGVQSGLLRGELVRLRKERDLTQERVAGALEWSVSKLIRMEGGGSPIIEAGSVGPSPMVLVSGADRPERRREHGRPAHIQD